MSFEPFDLNRVVGLIRSGAVDCLDNVTCCVVDNDGAETHDEYAPTDPLPAGVRYFTVHGHLSHGGTTALGDVKTLDELNALHKFCVALFKYEDARASLVATPIPLSTNERAAVIAGLRLAAILTQSNYIKNSERDAIRNIYRDCPRPLTPEQVDDLCERINTAE